MTQEQKEMLIKAIKDDRKTYFKNINRNYLGLSGDINKDIEEANNLREYVKSLAPNDFHAWLDALFDKAIIGIKQTYKDEE